MTVEEATPMHEPSAQGADPQMQADRQSTNPSRRLSMQLTATSENMALHKALEARLRPWQESYTPEYPNYLLIKLHLPCKFLAQAV